MFILTDDMKSVKPLKSLRWYEVYFLSFCFCHLHDIVLNYLLASDNFDLWTNLKNPGSFADVWLTIFILIARRFPQPYLMITVFTFGLQLLVTLLIINVNDQYGLITGKGWSTLNIHPSLISASLLCFIFFIRDIFLKRSLRASIS